MPFDKAKALQEAEKSVSQRKFSRAIKQYLEIAEKDPKDLTLLNTIGDLCVRQGSIQDALKMFNKLGDAYVGEGFAVKAIAIYKKISKLDPNSVGPLLKLAHLYVSQRLVREARQQYARAFELCQSKKQHQKALEIIRQIVKLDPENAEHLTRLARYYEHLGQGAEAAQVYLEAAEVAFRRGETAVAEPAAKRAFELGAHSAHLHLLRARLALERQNPEEVETILGSAPELKTNPIARELLLKAYLNASNMVAAEGLALEMFRARPDDFAPLALFSARCLEIGDVDGALRPLAGVADALMEQKNAGPLLDALRRIWTQWPQHVPTLELMRRICEATGDDTTLSEVLQALGRAYMQADRLDEAETIYRKLLQGEPKSEIYRTMVNKVLETQAKPAGPSPPALMGTAPSLETDSAAGGQQAMIEEALENSNLYARYGLADKALEELEKALALYPEGLEIHKRIFEVCQQNRLARAAKAAADLARILTEQGSPAEASIYEGLAHQYGNLLPNEEPAEPARGARPEPPPESGAMAVEAAGPPATSEDTRPPDASGEWDLSEDWERLTVQASGATTEVESPPFDFEESRAELYFYLEYGFVDEAREALEALEEKFTSNRQVAELRRLFENHAAAAGAASELPSPVPSAESESPTVAASTIRAGAETGLLGSMEPSQEFAAKSGQSDALLQTPGGGVLRSFGLEAESDLKALGRTEPSPSTPFVGEGSKNHFDSSLRSLLDELQKGAEEQVVRDDLDTHYSLGVAFYEMSLLDEAIGEFQKVVKASPKDNFPPRFLQTCGLLARCFLEKRLPDMAAKWYLRALESPDLDQEARLALRYELGVAYEQVGATQIALENFLEVYRHNIEYRDVAEKVHLLQQSLLNPDPEVA